MPISIVVGGQFGSEGKGKVALHFAEKLDAKAVVRPGGPNSGHTVIDSKGKTVIFRQLPTSALIPGTTCVLPSGCYIDLDVLISEINYMGSNMPRLLIDGNAVMITDNEQKREIKDELTSRIGSTQSGTGAAVSHRINRSTDVCFAKDEPLLRDFIANTKQELSNFLSKKQRILIEGTQGMGLSVLHSQYYPYVTSRDTSASSFLSETGLSPIDVDDIILVLRTFPIRVSGNSGPLAEEISWEILSNEVNKKIIEYTSVTNRIRRVARFDSEIVKQAILVNKPTKIVLNHMDYVDPDYNIHGELATHAIIFLNEIERTIENRIDYIGFGPNILIEKRNILENLKLCLQE